MAIVRCPGWLLCLLICGCLGPVQTLYPDDIDARPMPVLLVSHGWHAGLVLEREQILALLPEARTLPPRQYLEFGWGDAGYYTHPDPGFAELLRAALLPGNSVIHIAGIDQHPRAAFPAAGIIELRLSPAGLEGLVAFLHESLVLDALSGDVIAVADGLYADSIFVQAHGRYMLPRTSNTWTAAALRAAGLPITPAYALTRGNLMWQAARSGERLQ